MAYARNSELYCIYVGIANFKSIKTHSIDKQIFLMSFRRCMNVLLNVIVNIYTQSLRVNFLLKKC
jgi:hypothetical protein